VIGLSGGFAGIQAAATLEFDPSAPTVYDPSLELNLADAIYGDLVAGVFDRTEPGAEAEDYTRADFALTGGGERAFLARLRRTGNTLGLDSIPGVSSRGVTLPFLFGHGSTIGAVAGGAYSPRVDGITVRATAIAAARRALALGPSGVAGGSPLPGNRRFWPLALFVDELDTLPLELPVALAVRNDGRVLTVGVTSRVVGAFARSAEPLVAARPAVVGLALLPLERDELAPQDTTIGENSALVLVANQQGEAPTRVVGFAHVAASWTGGATTLTLTRRPSIVASEATALSSTALTRLALGAIGDPSLPLAHAEFDSPVLAATRAR